MLKYSNKEIYNLDLKAFDVCSWSKLENVRYFYEFFMRHQEEFEK